MIIVPSTRQTIIHIHQSIFTASNSKQVYLIRNSWCIWIDLSCGPRDAQGEARLPFRITRYYYYHC